MSGHGRCHYIVRGGTQCTLPLATHSIPNTRLNLSAVSGLRSRSGSWFRFWLRSRSCSRSLWHQRRQFAVDFDCKVYMAPKCIFNKRKYQTHTHTDTHAVCVYCGMPLDSFFYALALLLLLPPCWLSPCLTLCLPLSLSHSLSPCLTLSLPVSLSLPLSLPHRTLWILWPRHGAMKVVSTLMTPLSLTPLDPIPHRNAPKATNFECCLCNDNNWNKSNNKQLRVFIKDCEA